MEKSKKICLGNIILEGKVIRGFEGLDVRDRVRLQLIGTHVERGSITFARAEEGRGDSDLKKISISF